MFRYFIEVILLDIFKWTPWKIQKFNIYNIKCREENTFQNKHCDVIQNRISKYTVEILFTYSIEQDSCLFRTVLLCYGIDEQCAFISSLFRTLSVGTHTEHEYFYEYDDHNRIAYKLTTVHQQDK